MSYQKIDEIKNLLSTLSKESILIFGRHLWNLLYFFDKVPELDSVLKKDSKHFLEQNNSINDKIATLKNKRSQILYHLWIYLNQIYGEKVFGDIGGVMPIWCKSCIEDHLRGNERGKYTVYNEEKKEYDFILPEIKIIHTIWNPISKSP